MDIEKYKTSGRELYSDFAAVIADLLTKIIKAEKSYRLQGVAYRAKDIPSLTDRLEEKDQLDVLDIAAVRKDLAGCRVIFYTDRDVTEFLNSGLLHANFDIETDRVKVHHPSPDEEETAKLFQSHNYVVRLKPNRTELPEYQRFEDLSCEVQIQTILMHAWAEMEHDILYKDKELQGISKEAIEKRFADLMKDHLVPAGHIFNRIAIDVELLKRGKAVLDSNLIERLTDASDNNERYEMLGQFIDHVMPHFPDVARDLSVLLPKLKAAWFVTQETDIQPNVTAFGEFPGYERYKIAARICEILRPWRYEDIGEIYQAMRDLYACSKDEKSKVEFIKFARDLAKHELRVWEQYGPATQQQLFGSVLKEEQVINLGLEPLLAAICEEILKPEITGTSSTSDTISFHRGAVPFNPMIAELREKSLDFLETLADNAKDKQSVFAAMMEATKTPYQAMYSDEMLLMVFNDTARIIDIYSRAISKVDFHTRLYLETQVMRIFHINYGGAPRFAKNGALVEAQEAIINRATAFRDLICEDQEYMIHSALVHCRETWDFDLRDHEQVKKECLERVQECVDQVDDDNWSVWVDRLAKASETSRDNQVENFLIKLCERRPDLSLSVLNADNPTLRDFIPKMVTLLMQSDQRVPTVDRLHGWIGQAKNLDMITAASDMPLDLIGRLVTQIMETKEQVGAIRLMEMAVRQYDGSVDKDFWRDRVFIPCLEFLCGMDDQRWIESTWFKNKEGSLFDQLDVERAGAVLKGMKGRNKLDFCVDYILAAIARNHPLAVIEWFGDRLAISAPKYEPVPFELSELVEPLSYHPKELLAAVRGSYPRIFGGRRLVNLIFPKISAALEAELREYVATRDQEHMLFVLDILREYDGHLSIVPLCREIIVVSGKDETVAQFVRHALLAMGVVRGEYGMVQAYEEKKTMTKHWLKDSDETVCEFAEKFIRELDNRIASENRRADAQSAIRKLQYSETLGS